MPLRLMITDSGLGGLSVCAGLEQSLQQSGLGSGIELLYINANPDDRIGYNGLKNQAERITLFDHFLKSAYAQFLPDEIAIACNTLSVIYAETEFAKQAPVQVRGIVEAGVKLCEENLTHEPESGLIIFATETTTEANTYPNLINASSSRIIAQSCPGLAHSISNDASGDACRKLLKSYVKEALEYFKIRPQSLHAFLGCTHYGYQAEIFHELLVEQGVATKVLNPNDLLVQQLLSGIKSKQPNNQSELQVRFISRYQIPQVEVDSMQHYLRDSAPLTLAALHWQTVIPQLF